MITEISELNDIARTNYFLFKLRQSLNLKAEFFAKWDQMEKALNGGLFYSNVENPYEIPYTNIYFHDDLHFSRASLKQILVGKILVSIGTHNSDVDFECLLKTANDEFNKLLNEQGEKIISQVSRFLLHTICWENKENPQNVKEFTKRICQDFPNSEIFQFEAIIPETSFGTMHNYDVEIVFDKPMSKDNFVKKMKKHIPNLGERIFGYGYGEGNPVPNMEFGIRLYARQF